MDDHVVDHFGRGEHQQAVETEIAFCRAAAPAAFLAADSHAAVGYADLRSVIRDQRGEIFLRLCFECGNLFRGKGNDGRKRLEGMQFLFDPVLLAVDDFIDAIFAYKLRTKHMHSAFPGDADGDGLSAAADDRIRERKILHERSLQKIIGLVENRPTDTSYHKKKRL